MLSSRSFTILHFTFKPMIHFELIFVKGIRSLGKFFFFFACECPAVPRQIVEKTLFAPMCCVYSFVNNELIIFTWNIKRFLLVYLEKAMATHSSTLAWKILWTEGPGRLQSMGSQRVRHDWSTSLSLFTFMHWKREWQPTPVFLPGESQGRRSLAGFSLWGHTESDTTEVT